VRNTRKLATMKGKIFRIMEMKLIMATKIIMKNVQETKGHAVA
jgi:hypothetical protein